MLLLIVQTFMYILCVVALTTLFLRLSIMAKSKTTTESITSITEIPPHVTSTIATAATMQGSRKKPALKASNPCPECNGTGGWDEEKALHNVQCEDANCGCWFPERCEECNGTGIKINAH